MISPMPTLEAQRLLDNPREDEDDSLRGAARDVLRTSGYGYLRKLRCAAAAGVVTISGLVPSYFLKQMAQELVLRLAHVRQVKNLVQVRTGVLTPATDCLSGNRPDPYYCACKRMHRQPEQGDRQWTQRHASLTPRI